MRKDLVIIPEDRPGVVAELGERLGEAGINIEAISAFTGQGKGIVHLLVDRADDAVQVLRDAGFDVRAARRVVVVPLPDEPGHLGRRRGRSPTPASTSNRPTSRRAASSSIVCDDVDRAKELLGA